MSSKNEDILFEACCGSAEECLLAEKAGARRVEVCADLKIGGITPSEESLRKLASYRRNGELTLPVHVLIRPRGGDFVYTETEFEEMKASIQLCRQLGFQGAVFGILTESKALDLPRCQVLVAIAQETSDDPVVADLLPPLSCTFHRAVDETPQEEMETSLRSLAASGFYRVLTSGYAATALAGLSALSAMHTLSCSLPVSPHFSIPTGCTFLHTAPKHLVILPAGKIRPGNVKQILETIGCSEIHSACLDDTDPQSGFNLKIAQDLLNALV